jgi:hypothetical protein
MKDYIALLKAHLVRYSREQLNVTEPGIFGWRGREILYHHILPKEQADLNFLPEYRSALQAHLKANPKITRHRFFHHLSSSQAFAFNLFFPFLTCDPPLAKSFFKHFGTAQPRPNEWAFECVPDAKEGTNVDVAWTVRGGGTLFCEVKLTEAEFGAAKDLPKYVVKFESTYRGRLSALVPEKYLELTTFRAHYQILRNLALLHRDPRDRLVFLLPRENEAVQWKLKPLLEELRPEVRSRVRVVFIEELIESLLTDSSLPPALQDHIAAVKTKYVPLPGSR